MYIKIVECSHVALCYILWRTCHDVTMMCSSIFKKKWICEKKKNQNPPLQTRKTNRRCLDSQRETWSRLQWRSVLWGAAAGAPSSKHKTQRKSTEHLSQSTSLWLQVCVRLYLSAPWTWRKLRSWRVWPNTWFSAVIKQRKYAGSGVKQMSGFWHAF